jgi:hypothetical protein
MAPPVSAAPTAPQHDGPPDVIGAPAVPEPVPVPLPDPVPVPEPDLGAIAGEPPVEAAPAPVQPQDEQAPKQPETSTEAQTEAQTDGSNVNVSVRVLSPGEDGPVTQETGSPEVVSPPAEPDITAPPSRDVPALGATEAPAPVPAPDIAPNPAPGVSQSGSGNTNVSIRVASPGDDGAVEQTNASEPASDPEQYQSDNSQYQSSENNPATNTPDTDIAPWNWTWELTVCDGNATSSSTENGSSASRDWIWNWVWNWSCDPSQSNVPVPAAPTAGSDDGADLHGRGSGGPHAGPANVNVSIRVLSPGDNGPVTQTNTAPSAPATGPVSSDPSWLWVWTFTWCGQTSEITTVAGEGSSLDWLWNWSWYWSCEEGAPADTTDAAPATPEPKPATPQPAPSNAAPSSPVPITSTSTSVVPSSEAAPTDAVAEIQSVLSIDWASWPSTITDLAAWPSAAWPSADWPAVPLPTLPASSDVSSWPPPLPLPTFDVDIDITVPAVPSSSAPTVAGVPVVIPSIEIAIDFEPGGATARPQPAPSRPKPDAHRPRGRTIVQPDAAIADSGSPQVASSAPSGATQVVAAHSGTRASSRGGGRIPLPLDLPPLQAAGSSAAGGASASSLLLFGFASVIGFFVFAAPGLGRRIRLARYPRPRGRDGSSIDRPG